jgi:hypothetical protein
MRNVGEYKRTNAVEAFPEPFCVVSLRFMGRQASLRAEYPCLDE